jgi:hypothetical protein
LRSTGGILAALFHVSALPLHPAAKGHRSDDYHEGGDTGNENGHT